MRILLSMTILAMAHAAFAAEETLQNDGFVDGASVNFQGGFIAGETAAARFVPQIQCPCVVDRVTLLFGGTSVMQQMDINIWEDFAGNDAPGDLKFAGTVNLLGSNFNLQEIDLSATAVIVNGPFRVGLGFNHSGLPSVATDLDGDIDATANFIHADVGGLLFWFRSATLGVGGDFVIRATVDNFVPDDTDGDGVPDPADNCTMTANALQVDSDGDGYGNACDADINNDCVVNPTDLGLFKAAFFSTPVSPNWNPSADFNADDSVNAADLGVMRMRFFGTPGPSGVTDVCP